MSGFPLDSFDISERNERKSLIIPDRQAETAAAWMRENPEIAVVSRDRASAYASVQMERESGRFRKKCWPLFTPYCQKRDSSNRQSRRNTGRNS